MGSPSTEWTDEKHSLYLNTMEASFVSQLYSSKDMLASDPQSYRKKQLEDYSTGEFKVFRSGCWRKINFPGVEPQLNRNDEASSIRRNPWIQHYKSARKPQVEKSSPVQESSQSSCEANSVKEKEVVRIDSKSILKSSQVSGTQLCNEEVSDQNFADENFVEEKATELHSLKRRKTCG